MKTLFFLMFATTIIIGQTTAAKKKPDNATTVNNLREEKLRLGKEVAALERTNVELQNRNTELARELQVRQSGDGLIRLLCFRRTEWEGKIRERLDDHAGVRVVVRLHIKEHDFDLTVWIKDGQPIERLTTDRIIKFRCILNTLEWNTGTFLKGFGGTAREGEIIEVR